MYQAVAAALALTALAARVGLGYGAVDCCAPPCGCDIVVCCDPCDSMTLKPAAPQAPGILPAPAPQGPPPAPTVPAATPRTTNSFPSPPNLNTPAPAETPQPTLSADPPAAEPAAEQPPAEAPAAAPPETSESQPTETTEPPAAEEEAPRYSAPPAENTAPAQADNYEDLFPADPAESAPETPAVETPAENAPPADAADPANTDAAPATEESPQTPNYDDLFPPSSATEILSAPGGLASHSLRPWTNPQGHPLFSGRISKVTPTQILVTTDDGFSHPLTYSEISEGDLTFLRQQLAARQVQLAEAASREELLATQDR